jgi:glycosyltransferase involved in cell wall biosynthesis
MRLGIPVVVGPEPAVLEVAGGHAAVMADWTAQSLAETVARALERTPADTAAARAHAEAFTWRRVVEQTRQVLAEVSAAVR